MHLLRSFTIYGAVSDQPMTHNEAVVFEYLKERYENVQFKPPLQTHNRLYRPGIVLHFPNHPLLTVIVEVDEDFHKERDPELEAQRMKGIMRGYNEDFTFFIRFNPSHSGLNKLNVDVRLKVIDNKIKQILSLSKYMDHSTIAMGERVYYLFYPEERARQLELEFFNIR